MDEDEYYTHCEDWHTELVEGCVSCDARATLTRCLNCGREWVDGQMNAVHRAPYGVDPATCEHLLVDGWNDELLCPVGEGSAHGQDWTTCGDPITTPGAVACGFHQARIDAEETGKVYQRLVAQR